MQWITTIIIGAVIAWSISVLIDNFVKEEMRANIIAGMAGAIFLKLLFGSLIDIGEASALGIVSFWAMIWVITGTVLFVGIYQLYKRITIKNKKMLKYIRKTKKRFQNITVNFTKFYIPFKKGERSH